MRSWALTLAVATVILTGCAAPRGNSSAPSPTGIATAPSPAMATADGPASASPALPIDPAIAPISIRNHSAEAEAAFQACHIDQYGFQAVAGMGLVPTAAALAKYAPFSGREPQLKLPGPVWLVQFKGEIPMPKSGEIWIDPVCIKATGDQGYFAVNGVRSPSGEFVAPLPAATAPTFRLPPLQP
jgi:hypothetical protein